MEIHREKGTVLGGVHLEMTGELNAEGYSVVRFMSSQDSLLQSCDTLTTRLLAD